MTRKTASRTASALVEQGYWSLDEAARYLHASASTMRGWIRTKGLPHYKPGKELLFRQRELDAWMGRSRKGLSGLALTGFTQRAV